MPLRCHPEHIRSAQCELCEGSVALGSEMLRCAQHDSTVTHRPLRMSGLLYEMP